MHDHLPYNISIKNSYSLGKVSGKEKVEGFIYAQKEKVSASNNLYNKSNPASNNFAVGKDLEDMKKRETYQGWDFDTVWRIDEGRDYPRLRALTEGKIEVAPEKTGAGITANNLSKTYDGEAVNTEADLAKLDGWNGTGYTVSGLKESDDLSSIFNGGLTFNGAKSTWKGAVNAGEYVLDPTADLTEAAKQKYEIVWNTGKLTINKRPISLIGTKEYNGNPFVKAVDFTRINGLVDKDKPLAYDSKNKLLPTTLSGTVAATGSEVREKAYRLKDSIGLTLKEELAKNYEIKPTESFVQVTPKTIKVDGKITLVGNRVYDGTDKAYARDVPMEFINKQLIEKDRGKLTITGIGKLDSANATKVGERRHLVDLGSLALKGDIAKNYKLDLDNSYWTIAPKPLRVIGEKEYDQDNERYNIKANELNGTKIRLHTYDIPLNRLLIDAQKVSIDKSFKGVLSGKDVGKHKLLNFNELKLVGEGKDNYVLVEEGSEFNVLPRQLKLFVPYVSGSRNSQDKDAEYTIYRIIPDKDYDGTTNVVERDKSILWTLRRAGELELNAFSASNKSSEFNDVSVKFDAKFSQSDAGKNIPVVISNITLTGKDAKNFYIDPKDPFHKHFRNSLIADIKPLTISIAAEIKDGIKGNHRTFAQLKEIIDKNLISWVYLRPYGGDKFLNRDWTKGNFAVNKVGEREYAIQIGTLRAPNSNYNIEYNDRHIYITDKYDVSDYDSAILGLASQIDDEELTKKNESPTVDYIGIVSDVTSAPLAIAKHQFEAVSSYFDDTSRKWVSNFIREIESMNISVNIDFSNPNAIINAVNEEFKEFNSIAQYNTAYTLLIKGLREAKSAVDVPLKILDVVEKVSIIASIPDFVENAKDLVSDLIDNSKERENLKKVISSLRKNPGDRTAFGKLKYSLGNKWGKELALSYAKDANSIHTVMSELSQIISIIELEKKQNEIMNFLGSTTSLEGIAKLVIQQKILGDLISKGQISPSELSKMRLYDVKNNSLYIK